MGNNIAKLAQDEYWDEVKNRILMRTVEDVNSTAGVDGNTPLHEAAKHSHVDIVVLLMNAGANPHVINHDGLKPLDLASDNDITYFLGMCMLPVAVCAERCEWREVKRRLRARQISDINASFGEVNGWSLLTFATLHHQVDIATLLVRYKHIDVNFANRADGTTALHEAAAQSHVELVKLLLSAAGFNTPTDVQTCAHCTYVNPATHVACQICGLDLNPEAKKTSNVDELLERIHALEEANLCAICQEYVKDTVFGCGHETCATCAAKLTECPHCRILIVTRIRRYI
ncbi:hypothetical protein B5M09_004504 [Aphanomyces astaci]|uniref:RING-type domain-containing protein n=1 Tax=Aphanomyces astaci TaxID=112090 RepID=A0A3R7YCS3_APHAT|nr:hypothetical protein B5M09_004504 [Aphanomyces astaci]